MVARKSSDFTAEVDYSMGHGGIYGGMDVERLDNLLADMRLNENT